MAILGVTKVQATKGKKNNSRSTTVPKDVVKALGGLKPGDRLVWSLEKGIVTVKKQGDTNGRD